jgi:hypothetical protein
MLNVISISSLFCSTDMGILYLFGARCIVSNGRGYSDLSIYPAQKD